MSRSLNRLRTKAQSLGSNMTEVCRRAGVSRQTVFRGYRNEPVSQQVMERLEGALRDIASERLEAAERVLA